MAGLIPPELMPLPSQYPPFVTNDEQKRRWELCFAITRIVAQHDDPIFARQLFFSDFATDQAEFPTEPADLPQAA
jgi:hypothetical protein